MPCPPAPTFPAAREVGREQALPLSPSAPRMVKPKGLLGGCWPQDTASLGCGPATEQKFGRLEQDLLEHRTPWSTGHPGAIGKGLRQTAGIDFFVGNPESHGVDDPRGLGNPSFCECWASWACS